jgi:hypothetical protein
LADIKTHIAQPGRNWIYVIGNVEVKDGEDLIIPAGVVLVVASLDYATDHPGGFGAEASFGSLPGTSANHGSLTVKEGSSLTVENGAALIVGNTDDPSKRSLLVVKANARLYISGNAMPVVTTGSQIIVEKPDSVAPATNTGFFLPSGQLIVVGSSLGGKSVYGQTLDNALVVIESGAPAAIGDNGTVYIVPNTAWFETNTTEPPLTVPSASIGDLTTIKKDSPSKVAGSAAEIAFSETTTTVTYSGSTLDSAVDVGTGKTLVIAGAVDQYGDTKAEVTKAITVEGALEIAPGAEVTVSGTGGKLTAATTAEVAIPEGAKVKVASGGVVDLNALFTPPTGENVPGTGGTSSGKVALEGDIEVASGGTLRLSMGNGSDLPPEIDWTAGGSLKIESGGGLTLATPGETPDVPYIAESGTSGALYTWDDATGTGSITLSDGKIEMEGNITAKSPPPITGGVTAIIKANSTLKVADNAVFNIHPASSIEVYGTLDIQKTGLGIAPDGLAKLQLNPGGQVKVAKEGGITVYSSGDWNNDYNIKVDVYKSGTLAAPTQATASETNASSGDWTVTTATSGEAALNITLGNLKITSTASQAVGGATEWVTGEGPAAGSLKAGGDTVIVFTGDDGDDEE